jgi:uncharacterized membrane protein
MTKTNMAMGFAGLLVVIAVALPSVVSAQEPSKTPVPAARPAPGSTAPYTGMKPDRTTADTATRKAMQQKEAALRQQRADCRKQARQEKISLLKRPTFVSECMSR